MQSNVKPFRCPIKRHTKVKRAHPWERLLKEKEKGWYLSGRFGWN